ncbi:MAG: leucine-rich repeat domain-containing protein [Chitinophagales bacterium]
MNDTTTLHEALYQKKEEIISEYSKADLFEASRYTKGYGRYQQKRNKRIRENSVAYLRKFHSRGAIDDFPIQKGSEIVFVGNSEYLKYREVRQRLLPLEVGCKVRVKETTTHVVLGTKAPKSKGFFDFNVTIITPKELNEALERLEKPYLLEETESSEQNLQNLGDLLLSGQDENILLALEMFKGGGFSKKLLNELLIAHKTTFDRKVRAATKTLMYLHIAETSQAFVQRFTDLSRHLYERGVTNSLTSLTRNTSEFDGLKIGRYLYKKHQVGIIYLLEHLPTNEGLDCLQKYIEDDELDLSESKFYKLTDTLQYLPTLKAVYLQKCQFTTFPYVLTKLPNLARIDLSDNRLKALSLKIAHLNNLKVLKISRNKFKKVPSVLFRMPQLEELHIRFNPWDWNNLKNLRSEIEKLKKALPNCKIVVNK